MSDYVIAFSASYRYAVLATASGSAGMTSWLRCDCDALNRHRDELDDAIASIQERLQGVRVLSGKAAELVLARFGRRSRTER